MFFLCKTKVDTLEQSPFHSEHLTASFLVQILLYHGSGLTPFLQYGPDELTRRGTLADKGKGEIWPKSSIRLFSPPDGSLYTIIKLLKG